MSMIAEAEARGDISPGDRIIEATSGNTGIALAMAAAIRGYRMRLIMPGQREQRAQAGDARLRCRAHRGVSAEEGMEGARDLAQPCATPARAWCLTSLPTPTTPWRITAARAGIWEQTEGTITHFVSSMGTTGTIMGCSAFFKTQNPALEIVGLQPAEGASIPGIRRWPEAYLPKIFEPARVDRVLDITQEEAETHHARLAREEGIFCGVSAGGAVAGALRVARGS
jgi:cysteine synthase B